MAKTIDLAALAAPELETEKNIPVDKVKKPARKKSKAKKVRAPGITITEQQLVSARSEYSNYCVLKWLELSKTKIQRRFEEDQYEDILNAHFKDFSTVDAWMEPLLTINTAYYTRGDVVTAYTNEQGHRVPFTSFLDFICAQYAYTETFGNRMDCWNNMFLKGIKHGDNTWIDQYEREKGKPYPYARLSLEADKQEPAEQKQPDLDNSDEEDVPF